jgi:hypothetical protein
MAVCRDKKEHVRVSVFVSSECGSYIMTSIVACVMMHGSPVSSGHSLYTRDVLTSLLVPPIFILKPQKEILWIEPSTYSLSW